ncbi:MAG TPA: DUF3570 domain-containing protein [Steroidobacteraceae bacterium]|nr:DUF3570 domain-containing protein [Steroidobacteraceae bacterium]
MTGVKAWGVSHEAWGSEGRRSARLFHRSQVPSPRSLMVWLLALITGTLSAVPALATVLPEDRADALYHRYEGGGVTIHGPSVLVRKTMAEKYSVTANYYQDFVTSASIDVKVSGASEYKEERTQYSLGFDYLRGKTTYSLNFINSDEDDYQAKTGSFAISQDLFGDLTTITMSYAQGSDTVRRRDTITDGIDPNFKEDVDRKTYRVGVSQILTKRFILSLNLETITDEGYLNNPYRFFRYVDESGAVGLATEIYPHTHTSNAVSLSGKYYLPYRAAVDGSYRFYDDDWGIRASTFEVGYTHPLGPWTFETSFRYYTQDHADFYADLFPRRDFQNFMGRDKELSTFDSMSVHLGATYEFPNLHYNWIKKGTLSFYLDRMEFDFKDFRDARKSQGSDPDSLPGAEPMYSYGANVYQLFFSIWF